MVETWKAPVNPTTGGGTVFVLPTAIMKVLGIYKMGGEFEATYSRVSRLTKIDFNRQLGYADNPVDGWMENEARRLGTKTLKSDPKLRDLITWKIFVSKRGAVAVPKLIAQDLGILGEKTKFLCTFDQEKKIMTFAAEDLGTWMDESFNLKSFFQPKPATMRDVMGHGYQQAIYKLQRYVGKEALQTAQFFMGKKNMEETLEARIGGRSFIWDERMDDWQPSSEASQTKDWTNEDLQLEGAANLDWNIDKSMGTLIATTPAGTYAIEEEMYTGPQGANYNWMFWPADGSTEHIHQSSKWSTQQEAIEQAEQHWQTLQMKRKYDEPLNIPDDLHAAGGYSGKPYGWSRHGTDARTQQNPDFLMNSADWDCPACEEGNHTRCSSSNCDCAKNNHGMKRMSELFGTSPFDNQVNKNDSKKLPSGFLTTKMGEVGKNAQKVLDIRKQAGQPADPYIGDDGSVYAFPQSTDEDPMKLDAFGLWTDPNKKPGSM